MNEMNLEDEEETIAERVANFLHALETLEFAIVWREIEDRRQSLILESRYRSVRDAAELLRQALRAACPDADEEPCELKPDPDAFVDLLLKIGKLEVFVEHARADIDEHRRAFKICDRFLDRIMSVKQAAVTEGLLKRLAPHEDSEAASAT